MRNFNNISRQLTSTSIRPKYPMVWLPLHGITWGDDEASAAVDRANAWDNMQDSPVLSAGKITLVGTTAGIWSSNIGQFTPPDPGDVFGTDLSESMRAFCDLSTITTGGILVLLRRNLSALPASGEYIIGHSPLHGNGGWEIFQAGTSGQLFCSVKGAGVASVNVARDTTNPSVDTDYAQLVYMDVTNNTCVIFRDNTQQTTLDNLVADLANLPSGSTSASAGFRLLARANAANSGIINEAGTGTGGSTAKVSDIQMYRVSDDISGLLATIAAEYKKSPSQIPKSLRTYV